MVRQSVTEGNYLERTQDLQWQLHEQTDQQSEQETSAEVGAHCLAQTKVDRSPAKHFKLHTSDCEKQSWEKLHNSESKKEISMPSLYQDGVC